MKPYYENHGVTLYHGDCREVLKAVPTVDLLLTDPPYGVSWRSNDRNVRFENIAGDATTEMAIDGLRLSLRSLRPYRHVYAFGRFDLSSLSLQKQVELIWDKGSHGGGDISSPWGIEHEYIQFAVYVDSPANIRRGKGNLSARLRKGSVLNVPRLSGVDIKRHPAEKPVALLREMIESSSCIGELVLDPFAGVGSTLVASVLEGRRAIGIEIEERYCEIAARRLQHGVLPLERLA